MSKKCKLRISKKLKRDILLISIIRRLSVLEEKLIHYLEEKKANGTS